MVILPGIRVIVRGFLCIVRGFLRHLSKKFYVHVLAQCAVVHRSETAVSRSSTAVSLRWGESLELQIAAPHRITVSSNVGTEFGLSHLPP